MATFTFQQAYDLAVTNTGFKCKIATNHNNVCRLSYSFTADDLAAIKAGTLNRKQIIVREIKNCATDFCSKLSACCEQGYTDDGKGNLSKVMPAAPAPVAMPKNYVTQSDLDSGTINPPPPPSL